MQLYLHSGTPHTQLTWIAQHPWREGGPRKNKNLSVPLTHQKVYFYLSNSWIHKTVCEDLSSEDLKNPLLTVLLSNISCFWMTTSWLCNCKNTVCKLFQQELYLFFLKRFNYNSYTEHFWGEALQGAPLPGQTRQSRACTDNGLYSLDCKTQHQLFDRGQVFILEANLSLILYSDPGS